MWQKTAAILVFLLTLIGCMPVESPPIAEDHPANPHTPAAPFSRMSPLLVIDKGQAVKPLEIPSMGGRVHHGGSMQK